MMPPKRCLLLALSLVPFISQSASVAESRHAQRDVAVDTDPRAEFWRAAPAIIADRDPFGNIVPYHRTEVRSRWTSNNIYFLFICPYQELYLKPHPQTDVETNHLWEWDVAEVFIGSDFRNIRKYKEFEVSPQGEWIDLDIDLNQPHHENGWTWNSGFKVAARIDHDSKIWYACMRIPYSSVDAKPASPGNTLRVNFYRAQGPPSEHKALAWRPTNHRTYHVPEAFGILKLVE
jgi:cellulose/xylan binding protein with CBM9 domain